MPKLKNFPHQYNDLTKVRRSLEIYNELIDNGKNAEHDDIFGYALATAQVYTFRNGPDVSAVNYEGPSTVLTKEIEKRILEERRKPSSKQGARTAARELRRTLRLLGWVGISGELTSVGQRLLAAPPQSERERNEFRSSLLNMQVEGTHPVRILLMLIDQFRLPSRSGMELALVAEDDGIDAFAELVNLLKMPEDQRRDALSATDTQMKNAIKILPAWLSQTGLIAQGPDNRYSATSDGLLALQQLSDYPTSTDAPVLGQSKVAQRAPVLGSPTTAEKLARHYEGAKLRRVLDAGEQEAAARLLLERSANHQELVRALGKFCGKAVMYEDIASFDLLFVPNELDIILWEVKTIDGDQVAQVRRAAEQLPFYEYFYVRCHWPERTIRRAALFDHAPKSDLCNYLEYQDIGAFVLEGNYLKPLNEKALVIEKVLRNLQ